MSAHAPKVAALLAYEEGLLSTEGKRRLEAHLAGCTECREALASMRVYEQLRGEVKALAVPEPDWSRMELALRREARSRGSRAARTAVWAGLALAAAALLAFALMREDHTTVVEAPVVVPSRRVLPAADVREPITGEVTAVIDGVRGGHGDALAEVDLGATVREGMTLVTADPAEVHVRFYDETGVIVGAGSSVVIETLRRGRVALALERGTVSSEVASLGEGDGYEVRADPYVVRVRGTRFAVVHGDAGTAVTVDEGVVEILENGTVIEILEAPATWRSRGGVSAVEVGTVDAPVALSPVAARWPTLRVPRVTWVTSWQVGERTLPPGEIAMRAPEGRLHIEGRGDRDKVWRAELVMGPEGQTIEASAIRPAAPGVRTGTLAPELIAPVVRAGVPRLTRCQRDVDRETGVWVVGQFTLRVTIGRTGEVQSAELSPVRVSTEPPALFEQCILEQVRNWTFPPPTGGIVTFEQPLRYRTTPTQPER